nr:MAG TPA: hypothetical protein [Caudoviricetes sp.]DAW01057.1 MAG TPA: hypothetical protein [Caudoviricetes sp.]
MSKNNLLLKIDKSLKSCQGFCTKFLHLFCNINKNTAGSDGASFPLV